MRRLLTWIALLCILCSIAVTAGAAPAAKSISTYGTVASDGTCQMTLTVTLHLDKAVEELVFPLPEQATNVTVNGSRARSKVENGLRQVDVSDVVGRVAGDFTLAFTYSLPNLIVTNEAEQLELHLPILAGFAYPVQALEISVTLPGTVTAKPAFSSGYHQANIEKDLYYTTSGATITAVAQTELKDHETLVMTLLVSEEMFPQTRIAAPDFQTVNLLTAGAFVLALVYWLIFLRNLPAWPTRRPTPPAGYTAGELRSVLHLQGSDLTGMVFSWAQLGYLLIHRKPNGNILLYRQMDMGNERSAFEQRCFKMLFGRRNMVDTGTLRYGMICRSVEKMRPSLANLVHPRSGNMSVFQILAALAGVFGGVSVAIGLTSGAVLQWFLIIVLGILALCSSLYIQKWAVNLLSPDRRPVWIALGLCGVWILLSIPAGVVGAGLGIAAGQLLVGLLTAVGGRRTSAGRQAMGEVLGLRRYLKTVSQDQLRQICQNDPEYFHRMFPYALALGADKAFARQFGKLSIGSCPYVATGFDNAMRAVQWRELLRRVHKAMDAQRLNSRLEKIAQILQSFTR